MSVRSLFLALIVGMCGCGTGSTGDDEAWAQFVTQYAELYCDLREDCNPSLFESEFDGSSLMDEAAYTKFLDTCEKHH